MTPQDAPVTPASVLFYKKNDVLFNFDPKFRRLEDINWLWNQNLNSDIMILSTKNI